MNDMLWEDSFSCDYYHILMAQGFFRENFEDQQVCFELFLRYLPFEGGYAIFAGLESVLTLLSKERVFNSSMLEVLEQKGLFENDFIQYLKEWRFSGTIDAPKEGEVIFPLSPLLRVQGNILECHLIESIFLNILNYQSLVATKASRIFHLAKETPFIEMGLRRSYGPNGALFASRAVFIGGAQATSNIGAGVCFNIPIVGSMSHSWVMSHSSEKEAFLRFGRLYPTNQVFLVDTYNTLEQGLPNAIAVFQELEKEFLDNPKVSMIRAIRIDSGDLDHLSKRVREKLDQEGLQDVKIMVSDNIDEGVLSQLKQSEAPIDVFGIGTALVSKFSSDFSGVYKLVSVFQNGVWEPKIKISESPTKTTIAGRKNTMRFFNKEGVAMMDYVFLEEEKEELLKKVEQKASITVHYPSSPYTKKQIEGYAYGEILLSCVMENGNIAIPSVSLQEVQSLMKIRLNSLRERYKRLLNPHIYHVGYSYRLSSMTWKALEEHSRKKIH